MAKHDLPIVHGGLALILCSDQAALEESLVHLDTDAIPHQRLGNRALLVPGVHVAEIQTILHEQGIFPRLIGEVPDANEVA